MEQRDYLEFIKRRHDRLSNRARENGITKWAVLAAGGYLGYQGFGLIQHSLNQPAFLGVLLVFTALAANSLSLACIFYELSRNAENTPAKREVRLSQPQAPARALRTCLQEFLVIFCPLLLATAVLWNLPTQTTSVRSALWIDVFIFGVGAVISVVFTWFRFTLDRNTGLPAPAMALTTRGGGERRSFVFFLLLFLTAAVVNAVAFSIFFDPSNAQDRVAVQLAVIATLIGGGLFILLEFASTHDSLNRLESLELEVIINDIQGKEIAKRLEVEFLGHEFGSWLSERIQRAQAFAANTAGLWTNIEGQRAEIASLDPALRFEKGGRLRQLKDQVAQRLPLLDKECKGLVEWLNRAMATQTYRTAMAGSIESVVKALNDNYKQEAKKGKDLASAIDADLAQLP